MEFRILIVSIIVASIIGYFTYRRLNEEKFNLESSSKVLRFVAKFMQVVMYIAMFFVTLGSVGLLISQHLVADFVNSVDMQMTFSSSFFEYNVDASKILIDNFVSLIIVFAPMALYGLFVTSLIAKNSAKIFKVLSEGIVFSKEILATFKNIIVNFIMLFPITLFSISIKNEHSFNVGINLEFIATFIFFYIIYAVYKKSYEVYEESKLTI